MGYSFPKDGAGDGSTVVESGTLWAGAGPCRRGCRLCHFSEVLMMVPWDLDHGISVLLYKIEG